MHCVSSSGPQEAGLLERKMIVDAETPLGSDPQVPENTLPAIANGPLVLARGPPALASGPLWSVNLLLALASVPQYHASALSLLQKGLAPPGSGHPLPDPNLADAPHDPQAPTLSLPGECINNCS